MVALMIRTTKDVESVEVFLTEDQYHYDDFKQTHIVNDPCSNNTVCKSQLEKIFQSGPTAG